VRVTATPAEFAARAEVRRARAAAKRRAYDEAHPDTVERRRQPSKERRRQRAATNWALGLTAVGQPRVVRTPATSEHVKAQRHAAYVRKRDRRHAQG